MVLQAHLDFQHITATSVESHTSHQAGVQMSIKVILALLSRSLPVFSDIGKYKSVPSLLKPFSNTQQNYALVVNVLPCFMISTNTD